jgi:hypothetical protein
MVLRKHNRGAVRQLQCVVIWCLAVQMSLVEKIIRSRQI